MPLDHFNMIAGWYDRAGEFEVNEPLPGLLSLSPNDLVLDVGGGTGRVAMVLRDSVREVVVADVSRGMLRRAVGKGLATVCTPAESLPFPSESFDRVIMVDALHHVFDQRQAARELWRVVSYGGRIVIIEPDIRKLMVKAIAIGEKALLMRSHFLNAEGIASLFTDLDAKVGIAYDDFNIYYLAEKLPGGQYFSR